MAKKPTGIKKLIQKDGSVRWQIIVDAGRHPDGRRKQLKFSYDTQAEAVAQRGRILSELSKGTFVAPSKVTVNEVIAEWLAGRRKIRRGTRKSNIDSLKPVRDKFGDWPIQKLQHNKYEVDKWIDWMLKEGRRVSNKQKKTLAASTVVRTLKVFSQVLDSAVLQGYIHRNILDLVEFPTMDPSSPKTWTTAEVIQFASYVQNDRLYAAYLFSLFGMRRGEVVGARTEYLDLKGSKSHLIGYPPRTPTITIAKTRPSDGSYEDDPKSKKSGRTLPLFPVMVSALNGYIELKAKEREDAGLAYEDHPQLFVDELGRPLVPRSYLDRFRRLCKAAGVPVIRLHDTRHTCGTMMANEKVPPQLIAAWLGHAKVSFTMETYVHAQKDQLLKAGESFNQLLGLDSPATTDPRSADSAVTDEDAEGDPDPDVTVE